MTGNLFEAGGDYIIRVEVISIDEMPPAGRIADEFRMHVSTPSLSP